MGPVELQFTAIVKGDTYPLIEFLEVRLEYLLKRGSVVPGFFETMEASSFLADILASLKTSYAYHYYPLELAGRA